MSYQRSFLDVPLKFIKKKVVIEIKTVEQFTDVPTTQVLTYLKLGNYKLGLVSNFYVTTLKNGIKRMIN
ncbi:MAG: GxxExxY protein [Flavobacterium sp.]